MKQEDMNNLVFEIVHKFDPHLKNISEFLEKSHDEIWANSQLSEFGKQNAFICVLRDVILSILTKLIDNNSRILMLCDCITVLITMEQGQYYQKDEAYRESEEFYSNKGKEENKK